MVIATLLWLFSLEAYVSTSLACLTYCLAVLWHFSGSLLAVCWQLSGSSLAVLWQFSGSYLAVLWQLSGYYLAEGFCWDWVSYNHNQQMQQQSRTVNLTLSANVIIVCMKYALRCRGFLRNEIANSFFTKSYQRKHFELRVSNLDC